VTSERPVVSFLLDPRKAGPGRLRRTVRSLRAQEDGRWELLVHGSEVEELTHGDQVRFVASEAPNPADRLNALLEPARGELVAVIDGGGELAVQTVRDLAAHLDQWPNAQVFYTDEVVERSDRPGLDIDRKPAWSPERLRHQLYVGRLTAIRRQLVVDLGGFRPGYRGAHEHDLLLRVAERGPVAVRIPELLHRKAGGNGGSQASAQAGQVRAVQDHLDRRGHHATAAPGPVPDTVEIRRVLPPETSVSVVIPTDGAFGLSHGERGFSAVRAASAFIRAAGSARVTVTVVHTPDAPRELLRQLRELGESVRLLAQPGRFHVARMRNAGVLQSGGDYVVLADEHLEPEGTDFVEQLVAPLVEAEIGVTGPRILAAGGFHVGAGVAAYADQAEPMLVNLLDHAPDPELLLSVSRECSAVLTQCVALGRDTFHQVGGVNERLPHLHTVDLSAKVAMLGLSTVWVRPAVARWSPRLESLDQRRIEPVRFAEKVLFAGRWNLPELDRFVPTYGERLLLANRLEALAHDTPRAAQGTGQKASKKKRQRRLSRRVRMPDRLTDQGTPLSSR
jgi:hypothetical protein